MLRRVRFRLGTMLMVVLVVALGMALVVQDRRAAVREAGMRAELDEARERQMVLEYETQVQRMTLERQRVAAEAAIESWREAATHPGPAAGTLPP
jgi:hypothetical protein